MNPKSCLQLTVAFGLIVSASQCAALADNTNTVASEIAVLHSKQSSKKAKDAACVWLKRNGDAKSVPALAALLNDKDLSQSARYALESMPGEEAEKALIDALPKTSGLLKAGVIKSLGVRRDARAVPELAKQLGDSDALVVNVTASSLGDIGGSDALKALEDQLGASNKPSTETALLDGCLRCGQHWLKDGNNEKALAVYQDIYQRQTKEFIHVAAWRGMVLADQAHGLDLMANAITKGPAPLQMEAIQLVHEVQIPGATEAMAQLLPTVDPLTQVALIDGLSQRNDPASVPAIAALAAQNNPDVQVAALNALGILGGAQNVPVLIEVAAAGGPTQAAARQALTVIHGGNPNKTLMDMLPGSKPETQVEIIRALSTRSAIESVADLLVLAKNTDDPVRQAAFQALGRLVNQQMLNELVEVIGQMKTDDGRVAAAQAVGAACQHIERQNGTVDLTPVLAALKGGSAQVRIALLPICSGLQGPQTQQILRSAVADSNPDVHAAAVHALCDSVDPALLPDMEQIACKSSDEDSRTLGIEACVRLTTQDNAAAFTPADVIKLFKALMPAAKTPAEKRVVLSGLSTLPDENALKLAQTMVSDSTVNNEAASAVLAICSILPEADAAEAGLEKLIPQAPNDQVRQDAEAALKVIQSRADYITTWQYAGPYRQNGQNYSQLFNILFPPETPNAQGINWRPLPASADPKSPGAMDLLKVMGGQQEVAYARTSIHCADEQSAQLFINSDDGVKVWLNGQVVDSKNVMRGLKMPPDVVKITLKPGWNDLFLKVTQNDAGWGFIVRLTDADGAHLKGLQYAAGPAHKSL